MTYDNIPAELKALPQWCVCRDDKLPLNPRTLKPALTSNSSTWATFAEAEQMVDQGHADNLGFVVSQTDPYVFVDFDNKPHDPVDPEEWDMQLAWMAQASALGAYIETSASGLGFHLFIRGAIQHAAKRRWTELYDWGRFAIFTGDGEPVEAIGDGQDLLDDIMSHCQINQKFDTAHVEDLSEGEEKTDREVFDNIAVSLNADKFTAVAKGELEPYFSPEQTSEADASFFAMLSVHTRNREQMLRIFKAVPLSRRAWIKGNDKKRDKHQKNDRAALLAIDYALRVYRAEHPRIDFDALKERIGKITLTEARKEKTRKKELAWPPGIAGQIAQDIYRSSKVPCREYSIISTLGLLCGLAAREYSISHTGLNLYIVGIGETSTGKEGVTNGFNRWMRAIAETRPDVIGIRGPDYFGSGQGLRKIFDQDNLCKVSFITEFGDLIAGLTNNNASDSQRQLKRNLLAMFTKSGMDSILEGMAYSDKEKNVEALHGAAFSMIGEGVPSTFFSHLSGADIASGMLNRLLLVRNEDPTVKPPNEMLPPDPDPALVNFIGGLWDTVMHIRHRNKPCEVQRTVEGAEMLERMKLQLVDHMNIIGPSEERDLLGRSHLKALKLAALLAVADNAITPIVTADHAQWAIDLVAEDFRIASTAIKSGEMGGETFDTQIKIMVARIKSIVSKEASARPRVKPLMVEDRVFLKSELDMLISKAAGFSAITKEQAYKAMVGYDYITPVNLEARMERYSSRAECYALGSAFPW